MLKIAICDDNETALREAEAILRRDARVDKIDLYRDPKDFLADVSGRQKSFDAVLMDIDFGDNNNACDTNGIQIAEDLSHIDPQIQILYMTGYNDRYSQLVLLADAQPVGYLTKPLNPELLNRYLDKVSRKQGSTIYLTLTIHGRKYSIVPESILYLESHNHTVTFHTDHGDYTVYNRLDLLLSTLPSVFIRCHKSYAVNMNRIERLEPDRIWLVNGACVPISKTNRTQVREAFFRHIGGKI